MPDPLRPISPARAAGPLQGAACDLAGQGDGLLRRAAMVLLAILVLSLPLVVLSVLPLAAASTAIHDLVTPERAEKLDHILTQDCGSCHGLTMKGGLGSPLTPEALAHATPEGLALIILDGLPGTAMPAWRALLSEADALWIAEKLLDETP